MSCEHQISMDKTGRGKCALGLHDGNPWLGNCQKCIQSGGNTGESAPSESDFKVTFKKKGCGSCKPIEVVY
jgi:hypothetical protein